MATQRRGGLVNPKTAAKVLIGILIAVTMVAGLVNGLARVDWDLLR